MTEEQKQTAFSDPHFIPYDDRMSLMFGGGAYGPDVFSWELKDKLQEKYSLVELQEHPKTGTGKPEPPNPTYH